MAAMHSVEKFMNVAYPCDDPLFVCKSSESNCLLLCTRPMDVKSGSFKIFKHNLSTNNSECLFLFADRVCLRLSYELGMDFRSRRSESCPFDVECLKYVCVDGFWCNVFGENKSDQRFIHISEALFYVVCYDHSDNNVKLMHFLLDVSCKRCIELEAPLRRYPKLLYIPKREELLILGSDDSKRVWVCDMSLYLSASSLIWELKDDVVMPLCMPFDLLYDVVAFGEVVFVFYWSVKRNTAIWCLDLDKVKWYKCKVQIPCSLGCSRVLKDYYSYDVCILDGWHRKHLKVNVYDLVPDELVNDKQNGYKCLVIGFVRQESEDKCLLLICQVLIDIVLHYIPFLCNN